MPDDSNDRIRSSWDYLNRRSDRIDIETQHARLRDEVYGGILSGDDLKVPSALGLTSKARDEFKERVVNVIEALASSPMPDGLQWMKRLETIEGGPESPTVLRDFAMAYDRFYQSAKGQDGLELEKDRIARDVGELWAMLGGNR